MRGPGEGGQAPDFQLPCPPPPLQVCHVFGIAPTTAVQTLKKLDLGKPFVEDRLYLLDGIRAVSPAAL